LTSPATELKPKGHDKAHGYRKHDPRENFGTSRFGLRRDFEFIEMRFLEIHDGSTPEIPGNCVGTKCGAANRN
jgi:hypothetical protein